MKKHDYILIATVIFYVAENLYFGGNETAKSVAEKICDSIVVFGGIYGFASMFLYHLRPEVTVNINGVNFDKLD